MKTGCAKRNFLFCNGESDIPECHRSRIYSYDIMRGLAVVFMIFIHIVHEYARNYNEDSITGYIIEFLGGPPAAPAFMMLMGVFFIYSNKGTTRKSILRGLNILLLSFVLNLVRGIVPYYILTELKKVPIETLGRYFRLEYLIFEVDILTFAGLSYMLMAIIYHYYKKPIAWLALAIVIANASPLLWRIEVTQLPLQYATNTLWGDNYLSTFPLFPWLSFPLIGMVTGRLLKASENHSAIINKLGVLSPFLMVPGVILILVNPGFFYNAYGKMGIGAIIAIVGFVFFWQWALTKLHDIMGYRIKTGLLLFLSKNVLSVYVIHWVICKWGVIFFGVGSLGYAGVFIIFLSITILTTLLTWIYVRLNR